MSPFKVLNGREPPTLLQLVEKESKVEKVNTMIKEKNLTLDKPKESLTKAQEQMKRMVDKGRREIKVGVGDDVFLKIQPYHFRSLASHLNEKLSPHFYGPYEELEQVGKVACKLKSPITSKIHPVFHVSQLKRRAGPSIICQPLPDNLNEDAESDVQLEKVLDHRYFPQGELEILIKRAQLPDYENSWELCKTVKQFFSQLHLEDKELVDRPGNVKA